MKKLLFTLFLLGFVGISAFAQKNVAFKLEGIVVNAKNECVEGVGVYDSQNLLLSITDANGVFRVDLKSAATLVFSHVGYDRKAVQMDPKQLQADDKGVYKTVVTLKSKVENIQEDNPEDYATEKIKEAGSEVTSKTVDEADSQIKKTTKNAKNKINDIRERRAEKQNAEISDNPVNQQMSRPRFISKREKEKTVKRAVDAERKGIKTADKTAKTVNRSVKEGKVAIKTSEVAIKTTEKSAEASAKALKN